jgi:hypothetical protein
MPAKPSMPRSNARTPKAPKYQRYSTTGMPIVTTMRAERPATLYCFLNLQSDKSTQLLDGFGGVIGFLGRQDGDLAGASVQDAVMDCCA